MRAPLDLGTRNPSNWLMPFEGLCVLTDSLVPFERVGGAQEARVELRAFRTHLVIVLLTTCLECDRSMRMWPFRQMRIERTSGQRALIGTTAARQIRIF